jgi:hypothetical protein
MRIEELIDEQHDSRRLELLEQRRCNVDDDDRLPIVKGDAITPTVSFPCTCTATITVPTTSTATVIRGWAP